MINFFPSGEERGKAEERIRRNRQMLAEQFAQAEIIDREKLIRLLRLVTELISRTPADQAEEILRVENEKVKQYTDEQIIQSINYSLKHEVEARPFYYKALINFARERALFSEGQSSE